MGGCKRKQSTRRTNVRKYRRQPQQAKEKAANREGMNLEAQLPLEELIAGVAQDIETFGAELGLTIMQGHGSESPTDGRSLGQQSACRHGHQAGYVIYGGRKVRLPRPWTTRDGNRSYLMSPIPWLRIEFPR
jgi:hypothetical protein